MSSTDLTETARLLALDDLNIMDTSPEEDLNAIAEAAALVCDVPISLITLVDSERQWFKANVGLTDVKQTPREVAFCHHTIQQNELLEIPDALDDRRFSDNPLVLGKPGIRFYAGAQLTLTDGHRVGSICVIDRQPRKLTDKQRKILEHLATVTSQALQTNRTKRQLNETKARLHALSAAAPLGIIVTNPQLDCTYTNTRMQSILGLDGHSAMGKGWTGSVHPDDTQRLLSEWRSATSQSAGSVDIRIRIKQPNNHVRRARLLARPILDVNGTLIGNVAAVEDITEHCEQEQALHKSEQLLKHTGALAEVGGWELDIATGNLTWSEQTCHIHAVSVDYNPTLQSAIEFYEKDSRPIIEAAVQNAIDHGASWDLELPLRRADGQRIWVRAVGYVEYTNHQPTRVFGAVQDVTQKVRQRQAIEAAHNRMTLATDGGNIGIWEWDIVTDELNWTPLMYQLYGLHNENTPVNYEVWSNSLHPDDRASTEAALQSSIDNNIDLNDEFRILRPDGSIRNIRVSAQVTRDTNGKAVSMAGVNWDITQIRSLASELEKQHALLQVTLHSIGDAVITTNASGDINWMNPIAEEMTGWSADNALNRSVKQVFKVLNTHTRNIAPNPILECLKQNQKIALSNSSILISRNGLEYGIEDSAAPIRDEQNNTLGAVLVFRDVTAQRKHASEMTYRATHDALTGLYNRTEFESLVSTTLTSSRTSGNENALFFVDLDQFKLVNDACGHTVGDKLLLQIARLITACVRDCGRVARLGGDEFGVLLENCNIKAAEDIAQGLCDRMNDFRFIHEEQRFRIGTSIGLVSLNNRWSDVADIMQAADIACYAAKDAGRNRVHRWFDTDNNMNVRSLEMKWATQLEQALDEDKFVLYAQRLDDLTHSDKGLHLEVLLRMKKLDETLVLPDAFLPAAERFHLANRIDRWVLKHAVEKLLSLPYPDQVSMLCINLSGQSVGDRVFHRDAIDLLTDAGTEVCKRICFEITETAAITNMADASVFINQLHSLDIKVALDDFGAGASSFGYLRSLNVDTLKIDGQFIKNMLRDPLDAAAVRCFVDVAKIQGLRTVAEYVDNEDVLLHVKQMGIDFAQGFLLHKPEPIDDLLVKNNQTMMTELTG